MTSKGRPAISQAAAETMKLADTRTIAHYFAYLGVMTITAMIAIFALYESGRSVMSYLDGMRRPAEMQAMPIRQDVNFALLPNGVPNDIKNSELTNQF
jgi:hypothetical protein